MGLEEMTNSKWVVEGPRPAGVAVGERYTAPLGLLYCGFRLDVTVDGPPGDVIVPPRLPIGAEGPRNVRERRVQQPGSEVRRLMGPDLTSKAVCPGATAEHFIPILLIGLRWTERRS